MRYLGGKSRIAKSLVAAMGANERPLGQWFVEPFCGACNVTCAVGGLRLASDANPWLIHMWESLRSGTWEPPEDLTEERYSELKTTQPLHPDTAFAGFGCSFGGKWFGGFARGEGRDFPKEARAGVLEKRGRLSEVHFTCALYQDLQIPPNSLIYCDPPYAGTTGYGAIEAWDAEAFYQWCRDRAAEGHDVYVSEYSAPEDFEAVWRKETKTTMAVDAINRNRDRVERLYRVRGLE